MVLIGSDTSDLDLDRHSWLYEAGAPSQGIGAVMVLVLGMTTAAKPSPGDSKTMIQGVGCNGDRRKHHTPIIALGLSPIKVPLRHCCGGLDWDHGSFVLRWLSDQQMAPFHL